MDLDGLQRSFFDWLYTYRIEVAIATAVLAVIGLVFAWRLGWFAAARRHPARAGVLLVVLLAVALPLGYYTASPLWIRTVLIEPAPAAILGATPTPAASHTPVPVAPRPTSSEATPSDPAPAPPAAGPFAPRTVASGTFHGTDEFHFGRGTATVIETAPGRYTLRFEAFSVRNGPDLYVYLSPDADDYARGALELGVLKATDGAFGYELPAGTDPADFASAIVWCKQFSHLFAVAPLTVT
jgi:hypothetical protein